MAMQLSAATDSDLIVMLMLFVGGLIGYWLVGRHRAFSNSRTSSLHKKLIDTVDETEAEVESVAISETPSQKRPPRRRHKKSCSEAPQASTASAMTPCDIVECPQPAPQQPTVQAPPDVDAVCLAERHEQVAASPDASETQPVVDKDDTQPLDVQCIKALSGERLEKLMAKKAVRKLRKAEERQEREGASVEVTQQQANEIESPAEELYQRAVPEQSVRPAQDVLVVERVGQTSLGFNEKIDAQTGKNDQENVAVCPPKKLTTYSRITSATSTSIGSPATVWKDMESSSDEEGTYDGTDWRSDEVSSDEAEDNEAGEFCQWPGQQDGWMMPFEDLQNILAAQPSLQQTFADDGTGGFMCDEPGYMYDEPVPVFQPVTVLGCVAPFVDSDDHAAQHDCDSENAKEDSPKLSPAAKDMWNAVNQALADETGDALLLQNEVAFTDGQSVYQPMKADDGQQIFTDGKQFFQAVCVKVDSSLMEEHIEMLSPHACPQSMLSADEMGYFPDAYPEMSAITAEDDGWDVCWDCYVPREWSVAA